jgi:N6-adenosine-specific RNA methylase IME4
MAEAGHRFKVIYADPPWEFKVYSPKGKQRSADRHYDCPSLDALKTLPIAPLAADDCALFLWGVWPELPGALELIKTRGFEYKTVGFLWVKTSSGAQSVVVGGGGLHWGMGHWTRANSEFCLLATKGAPLRLAEDIHQSVVAPVGVHSVKPEEVRRRIGRLLAGPYLDFPDTLAPVVRTAQDGERELTMTRWGFPPPPSPKLLTYATMRPSKPDGTRILMAHQRTATSGK